MAETTSFSRAALTRTRVRTGSRLGPTLLGSTQRWRTSNNFFFSTDFQLASNRGPRLVADLLFFLRNLDPRGKSPGPALAMARRFPWVRVALAEGNVRSLYLGIITVIRDRCSPIVRGLPPRCSCVNPGGRSRRGERRARDRATNGRHLPRGLFRRLRVKAIRCARAEP